MGKIIDIESPEDFAEALENAGDKLVIADFWATWCGPCKIIGPYYDKLALDSKYNDVIMLKLDVDELGELAEEWEIQCMPTFLFIKNCEKVGEMAGANRERLKELLDTLM